MNTRKIVAGPYGWILAVWLIGAAGPAHAAEATGWTDARLAGFLADANSPEAVLIASLTVSQGGKELILYDQTGVEERNRNRRRRPILVPIRPDGPFIRGTRFVARVDRTRDIEISARLEQIGRASGDVILRTDASQARVRLHPEQDAEVVPLTQGELHLRIPAARFCSQADVELARGDERHILSIRFLNKKAAVTLSRAPSE